MSNSRLLLPLLAAATLSTPAICASDARVLDERGRVLTVGNWALQQLDGGRVVRVPDTHVMSWELRDGATLVAEGEVPGTADRRVDATPAISRNPVTNEILLAWSRQEDDDHRDIMAIAYVGDAWQSATLRTLVSSDVNEMDPVLVHDMQGNACLAWRTMDFQRDIMVLTLAPDGRILGSRPLSQGISVRNGAPRLGVDASGRLYVAFFGLDAATAESRLFVLAMLDQGGGTIHLPEPVLEFGLRAGVPVPLSVTDVAEGRLPALHATTLGGTPLMWWTEVLTDGRLVMNHVVQSALGEWQASAAGTIDLGPASVAPADAVQAGLDLLEARMRRVQSPVGGVQEPLLPGRSLVEAIRRW